MASIGQLKLPDNNNYNLSVPFVIGTGDTAGAWFGKLTGLTAYYDGLLILYKPPVAGASTTTLNLNSLGAKTCYINNTTKLTTHFPVNQPILLVYSASQNSGCWMCVNNYWANTNNAVTQTATSTNSNYEVLFSGTADNTTRTEGARKNSNLRFNPSTGALQANKLQGIDSSGKVRVEFYNDAEDRGRFYLYNGSQSSQIEMVGDGAINVKNSSGTANIILTGNNGNIKCTTINGHNIPTTLSESVTYSFNATTTLSYIGKSITCGTGTKIVRAYFRYVHSAPVETAVVRSSTSLGSYYCDVIAYGKDASSPCLTFIIKAGETFYFWAKYSGNAQNNLDVHSVYIQDN